MSVRLFSIISGLAGSLEVAHEARAASGELGKAEDCGWRGSSEGKALNSYSNNSYSSGPFIHNAFVSLQRTWAKLFIRGSKKANTWTEFFTVLARFPSTFRSQMSLELAIFGLGDLQGCYQEMKIRMIKYFPQFLFICFLLSVWSITNNSYCFLCSS